MTGLSDKLKVSAVQFLLWQKKCMLFTLEQSDGLTGRPDVFGLTKNRETIEIEIKVSVSDFLRNKNKLTMKLRDSLAHKGPNYFYYMMPNGIAQKVQFRVEDKHGLICWDNDQPNGWRVLKRATKIHPQKTSVQRIASLVREQSSTCLGLMEKLRRSEFIRKADAERARIDV
jgi:hypothetical protein